MEEDLSKIEFANCGEVELKIQELELEEPAKNTVLHNEWEEKMNYLFELYNKLCMFVAYKLFK